ncbi:hypothetical protein BTN50_0991 [Candidatus Enterovibrio altilux]|uniref:Uncharacterized protein n=1 Tax=Candidatus Enterovibrio altilux TaxID=1927128 RepID=A0A291B924_9GAMM|nr:hypothetical protein BTN50_0991 [Candidatus Enterovibrio luxaltus]
MVHEPVKNASSNKESCRGGELTWQTLGSCSTLIVIGR